MISVKPRLFSDRINIFSTYCQSRILLFETACFYCMIGKAESRAVKLNLNLHVGLKIATMSLSYFRDLEDIY